MLKLKELSQTDIDEESFKLLLEDIENNNLNFQISLQENNYIKSCEEKNLKKVKL